MTSIQRSPKMFVFFLASLVLIASAKASFAGDLRSEYKHHSSAARRLQLKSIVQSMINKAGAGHIIEFQIFPYGGGYDPETYLAKTDKGLVCEVWLNSKHEFILSGCY